MLDRQATYYIGAKTPASLWTETGDSVPRMSLTVMNSSNFFFADNTQHDANVFSIIDTFDYIDASGNKLHLQQAECDYAVIGWHSKVEDDPLSASGVQGTFDERLRALFLQASAQFLEKNGTGTEYTRLICHGTIYNVLYDTKTKPSTPADDFAKLFTEEKSMEPVSIGATPFDSVFTFLQAHKANADSVLGSGPPTWQLIFSISASYYTPWKKATTEE